MRKKYTVIRHARLVDGTGAPAIEDAVFVFFNGDTVSDDRLVYCGDAAGYDPSITADGEVFALDLADSTYTILPGLVNTHVHLSLISFLSLPVRKPFIYAGFRLSLYFYYTLFTPFFQLWV